MTAVVAIINYKDKILVGKKKSNSEKVLAGRWHIPGETIIGNETDEQALIRGMKEETGLTITVGKYIGSSITPTSKSEARWYECFADTDKVTPGSDLEKLTWIDKETSLYCLPMDVLSLMPAEVQHHLMSEDDKFMSSH
jgi:ADP-ribose pyrophosphatase YjhB (NUDIX family)